MPDNHLKVLGHLHVVDRKVDRMIGKFATTAARKTQDREADHADLPGLFERAELRWGVARCPRTQLGRPRGGPAR